MISKFPCAKIAQLVEHVHGKDEVRGSIPRLGSQCERECAVF